MSEQPSPPQESSPPSAAPPSASPGSATPPPPATQASPIRVGTTPQKVTPADSGEPSTPVPLRRDLRWVFMIIAAVMVLFPMWTREKLAHCPNDASRWNTIFFMLEYGTMEWLPDWEVEWDGGRGNPLDFYPEHVRNNAIKVGDEYYTVHDLRFWHIAPFMSIDMIAVKGEKEGEYHYYSSKPPLLTLIYYGVTWTVQQAQAGVVWTSEKIRQIEIIDDSPLSNEPSESEDAIAEDEPSEDDSSIEEHIWTFKTFDGAYYLMRTTVTVAQVLPFLFCVWLLAHEFRRMSDSLWVRNFCIACAALGTYLTPYLVPLTNHVPAACSVTVAIYAAIRIWYDNAQSLIWYILAGTFGALAFICEIPALSVLAVVMGAMLIRSPKRMLIGAVLPVVIILGAYFHTTHMVTGKYKPIPSQFEDDPGIYRYPGSYWHPNKYNPGGSRGIDALMTPEQAEEDPERAKQDGIIIEEKSVYIMHMLVGHHGFFLLTPVFLIALLGLFANLIRSDERARPLLALVTLGLTTAVVLFFGLVASSRNYGGVAQGMRWMFWTIPLWLLMLPAGASILSRVKVGRAVCYMLLAVSLFSVYWALPRVDDATSHPFSNSWAHLMFRKDWSWIPDVMRINY